MWHSGAPRFRREGGLAPLGTVDVEVHVTLVLSKCGHTQVSEATGQRPSLWEEQPCGAPCPLLFSFSPWGLPRVLLLESWSSLLGQITFGKSTANPGGMLGEPHELVCAVHLPGVPACWSSEFLPSPHPRTAPGPEPARPIPVAPGGNRQA